MAAKRTLGQVVAIANDVARTSRRALTDVYQLIQKTEPMTGRLHTYRPRDEDGDVLPEERQRVQVTVAEELIKAQASLEALMDAVAARDYTNASGVAVADVVVGEHVLVEKAPVSFLLFLDDELKNLETVVRKLPTHDPASAWTMIDPRGVWASEPVETVRSMAEPRATVIVPPTAHHPAQVQQYTEQVVKGYWTKVQHSGAVPVEMQATLLDRVHTLQRAVHIAREEANKAEAVRPAVGRRVMDYLLG